MEPAVTATSLGTRHRNPGAKGLTRQGSAARSTQLSAGWKTGVPGLDLVFAY